MSANIMSCFEFGHKYIQILLFKVSTFEHDRITRQTNKLHVPAGKTEAIKKSIRFMGVKIWNEFSNKIDYNCCIYTYNQRVKSYLLSNEPL